MTKYLKVEWPEYQMYMEHPEFYSDCFYCAGDDSYFIPEEIYSSYDDLLKEANISTECE